MHGVVNTKGALTYTVLDTTEYSIFFSFRLENYKFTMHHVANTKGALAHTVLGTFEAYGQGEISEQMRKKAWMAGEEAYSAIWFLFGSFGVDSTWAIDTRSSTVQVDYLAATACIS